MKVSKPNFHIQQSRVEMSPVNAWKLLTNPHALRRLTPPWFSFEITSGPKSILEGNDYGIKITKGLFRGHWILRAKLLREGFLIGFEIRSPRGKKWVIWTKLLPGEGPHDCILEDRIEYQASRAFGKTPKRIEKVIKELVYYRHHTLKTDLASLAMPMDSHAQKILIAGGTGLVGSHFTTLARMRGHQVKLLSTREFEDTLHWDPERGMLDATAIEGYDTIINLAGYPIACRWSAKNKQRILDSRVKSTHLLVKTIQRLDTPPKHFIQASATGYYGFQNKTQCDEQSPKGDGFLADVCEQWEKELHPLRNTQIQTSILRLGVVLSPQAGALAKMLPAFKLGIGGKLGSGKQPFPWVSILDISRMLMYLTETSPAEPVFNACAPDFYDNIAFTKTLTRVISRPAIFAVPGFALKLIYGKMAEEALLGGVHAYPRTFTDLGFKFTTTDLEESLRLLLGKS